MKGRNQGLLGAGSREDGIYIGREWNQGYLDVKGERERGSWAVAAEGLNRGGCGGCRYLGHVLVENVLFVLDLVLDVALNIAGLLRLLLVLGVVVVAGYFTFRR